MQNCRLKPSTYPTCPTKVKSKVLEQTYMQFYLFILTISNKMARKKIREYDSKRLFKAHFKRLTGIDLPINVAQIKENSNWSEVIAANPWLTQQKLVVKPDCLFGQRCVFLLINCFLNLFYVSVFFVELFNTTSTTSIT